MGKPHDPKSPDVPWMGMYATIDQAGGGGITFVGASSGLLLRMG
jgi:hypothetical protein